MLKDSEPPKEPPSEKAKRKWNNHLITKRFLEERDQKPKEVKAADGLPPDPADVIANDDIRHGPVKRLETKFAKEIRKILQGHVDKNVMLYVATLAHQKRRLLKEKLRRLEAAHQGEVK